MPHASSQPPPPLTSPPSNQVSVGLGRGALVVRGSCGRMQRKHKQTTEQQKDGGKCPVASVFLLCLLASRTLL